MRRPALAQLCPKALGRQEEEKIRLKNPAKSCFASAVAPPSTNQAEHNWRDACRYAKHMRMGELA